MKYQEIEPGIYLTPEEIGPNVETIRDCLYLKLDAEGTTLKPNVWQIIFADGLEQYPRRELSTLIPDGENTQSATVRAAEHSISTQSGHLEVVTDSRTIIVPGKNFTANNPDFTLPEEDMKYLVALDNVLFPKCEDQIA